MTDNSKLTLRWEIDNAIAKFATGKVESEVFNEGGFKWTVKVELISDRRSKFTLRCALGHNRSWRCETEVDIYQHMKTGVLTKALQKKRVCFSSTSCLWVLPENWSWSILTDNRMIINGKVIFEFHIKLISSDRGELIASPGKFAAPNEMSNVILKIGGKNLHVSKEYLAVVSPVFKTMFFGEFAEKGKEEVELKDVVYEEFIDLLNLIYVRTVKITDRTVVHILKLADRFQMKTVFEEARMHLVESKEIEAVAKLIAADQYNFADLRDNCLKSFTSANQILQNLQSSPESEGFSDAMKAAIYDRLLKLGPK